MAIDESSVWLVHHAYSRLAHDELSLFLKVRNLPTSGTDEELASRLANHDLHTYHFEHQTVQHPSPPSPVPPASVHEARHPDLPVELVAAILEIVGDWELSKAVGIATSIPCTQAWAVASPTDLAILSGSTSKIRAADPLSHPPTKLGAIVAIKFSYINVFEYFLSYFPRLFLSLFKGDLIPTKASSRGRTDVLSWWKKASEDHPEMISAPKSESIREAVDGASRNGQIASLNWWMQSGLQLEYSEASLESASARNHVQVLEWWKQQNRQIGLPLKVGRVMDTAHVPVLEWWATSQIEFKYDKHVLQKASCHGRIDILKWWLGSGLQLSYDEDVLTGATRHNRPEVLDWWDKSGLHIEYRVCDIEEALEDALGGGENARAWWKDKGVDFNANDKEWMKLQSLN